MSVITANDVREDDAEPAREDQHRAEWLEIERARATAGPAVRADGGEPDERPPLDVGDHVQDRNNPDAPMIVYRDTGDRADEYEFHGRDGVQTIAQANPNCHPLERVYEVIFPHRTDIELIGKEAYAYPRSRLEIVTRLHDRDDGGEE